MSDETLSVHKRLLPSSGYYPPVDWSALIKKNGNQIRFMHPAIYPEDSILKPFMDIGRKACVECRSSDAFARYNTARR
jgi:hypothetical protein